MALILKRITNPYECVRCSVTKKLITYGEEYYWDPIDNFVVDFEYYYDRKLAMKREEAMWKINHQATLPHRRKHTHAGCRNRSRRRCCFRRSASACRCCSQP